MSSFNDTVALERSLIHLLTNSKMSCRMYIVKMKPRWFTSEARKFIVDAMLRVWRDSSSTLSETVFEYELTARASEENRDLFTSEWKLLQGMDVIEDVEALMELLHEADVGRKVMGAAEEVAVLLEKGDISNALVSLKRSAMQINPVRDEQRIVELTEYQHRLDLIRDKQAHPEKYLGLRTGFPTWDKYMGGLWPGELTLIAGITGVGKSTLLKQIEKGIVTLNPGKNILHIANEEHQMQVETKFDSLFTEIPYMDFKLASITEKDLERWIDFMQKEMAKFGRVFVKEVPAFSDMTLVEHAYRELEHKGIAIHAIIIDHLPHVKPIEKVWSEIDEQTKAATDCKEIARMLHLPVVTAGQAATGVEDKQSKGRRAGKLDIYGSKGPIHVSNNFSIITVKGHDNTDESIPEGERDVIWLWDSKKGRDNALFSMTCIHRVKVGVVEEVVDAVMADALMRAVESQDEEDKSDGDEVEEDGEKEPEDIVEMPQEEVDDGGGGGGGMLARFRRKKLDGS